MLSSVSVSIHLCVVFKTFGCEIVVDGVLLSFCRPEHTALHEYLGVGRFIKYVVVMTERGVEHSSVAPELRPCYGHINGLVGDMVVMYERETCGSENLDGRVYMEVVVLTANVEVFKSFGNGAEPWQMLTL